MKRAMPEFSGIAVVIVAQVAPAVSSRLARLTGDEDAYAKAQQHLDDTVQSGQETEWLEQGVAGLARGRYSVPASELELPRNGRDAR